MKIVRAGHLLATGYVFEGVAARRGGKVPEEALAALVGLAGQVPDEQLEDWLVRRFARDKKRTLHVVEARLSDAGDDEALLRLRDALKSA